MQDHDAGRGRGFRATAWVLTALAVLALATVVAAPGGADEQIDRAAPTAVQARSADAFVDSIGFNTHLYYFDTPYGRWSQLVTPALRDLGIRHIRDGGVVLGDNQYVDYLAQLNRDLGIKTLMIMDPRAVTPTQAQVLAERLAPALSAVEGPNEYDIARDPWVDPLITYGQQLDAALANDPQTAHLALVAPSLVRWDSSSAIAGRLVGTYDIGNMHPYPYPNRPSGNIDGEIRQRALPTGSAPMWATETGYHTAQETRGVSEAAQARLLPRTFLEYFRRGVTRTYSYELLDQFDRPTDPESRFGIIRQDGTRKPAFTAIANLISLLRDPGPAFTPGSLTYDLAAPSTVSQLLLQHRDGSFSLVLWNEVDPAQSGSVNATLTLGAGADVTTYLPNVSTAAQSSLGTRTSVTLSVPDHPLVVRIRPGATTPTTAAPTTTTPTTAAPTTTSTTARPTTTTTAPTTTSTTAPNPLLAWLPSGAATLLGDVARLVGPTTAQNGGIQLARSASTDGLTLAFDLTMSGGAGRTGTSISLLDPASGQALGRVVLETSASSGNVVSLFSSPDGGSWSTTREGVPAPWSTNRIEVRIRSGWLTALVDGRPLVNASVDLPPMVDVTVSSGSGGATVTHSVSRIAITPTG